MTRIAHITRTVCDILTGKHRTCMFIWYTHSQALKTLHTYMHGRVQLPS